MSLQVMSFTEYKLPFELKARSVCLLNLSLSITLHPVDGDL